MGILTIEADFKTINSYKVTRSPHTVFHCWKPWWFCMERYIHVLFSAHHHPTIFTILIFFQRKIKIWEEWIIKVIAYIILRIPSNTVLAIKNDDILYQYFNKFDTIMAHHMPPCALNTVWVVSLNTTPPPETPIALPVTFGQQGGNWGTESSVPYAEAPTVELASMPSTLTPRLTLITTETQHGVFANKEF